MRTYRKLSTMLLVAALVTAQACRDEDDEAQTHAISGTITGASGVTVTLGGAAAASTTTDGTGKYSFTALANGSYTVTPSKPGYTFEPESRSVTVSGANVTGQDFGTTSALALEGTTWTYCQLEENFPQDQLQSVTYIGGTMYFANLEYESADSSCSGAAHGGADNAFEWPFTLGGDIEATLGGVNVTARAILNPDDQSFQGVLYVDAAPDPDALYLGPESTDLWLGPHFKEDVPGVTAPALQGTWISCNTEDLGDLREVLAIRGYAISVTGTRYASNDGSCSGASTIEFQGPGAFVLREPTSATLGGATVTARKSDTVLALGMGSQMLYSILYVDTSVTPNVLYTGDELADPGLDGSAPNRRPVVLQHSKPRIKQP